MFWSNSNKKEDTITPVNAMLAWKTSQFAKSNCVWENVAGRDRRDVSVYFCVNCVHMELFTANLLHLHSWERCRFYSSPIQRDSRENTAANVAELPNLKQLIAAVWYRHDQVLSQCDLLLNKSQKHEDENIFVSGRAVVAAAQTSVRGAAGFGYCLKHSIIYKICTSTFLYIAQAPQMRKNIFETSKQAAGQQ